MKDTSIIEFFEMSVKDQNKLIKAWERGNEFDRPFYIGEIIKALENNAPLILGFYPGLIQIYYNIINFRYAKKQGIRGAN